VRELSYGDGLPFMVMPIIDCQDNGIGDVVVACWIASSAKAANLSFLVNPRQHRDITTFLGVEGRYVTDMEGPNWSQTPGIGHQYEYAIARSFPRSRFEVWCEALGIKTLVPVRPNFVEDEGDRMWASEQWGKVTVSRSAPRVLLFPDSAWIVRQWPHPFFAALTRRLLLAGCAPAVMAGDRKNVEAFGCWHWWGCSLSKVASMMRQADLVIANDSGPAHLAGAVGTSALAICGPTTQGVFAHDERIAVANIEPSKLACSGCYFSPARGFTRTCGMLGCEALLRLTPDQVLSRTKQILENLRTNRT
jgi:hypothetical protein